MPNPGHGGERGGGGSGRDLTSLIPCFLLIDFFIFSTTNINIRVFLKRDVFAFKKELPAGLRRHSDLCLGIPILGYTHTWVYPYLGNPMLGYTHTWVYPYLGIPILGYTHTWVYPYLSRGTSSSAWMASESHHPSQKGDLKLHPAITPPLMTSLN